MKTNFIHLTLGMAFAMGIFSCQSGQRGFTLEHQGDSLTIIHITQPSKYLLFPIQENSKEGQVKLDTGNPSDTEMDIRLSTDSVEYYVPFALSENGKEAKVIIRNVEANAICWDSIRLSNTFDTANRDKFRPVYHHTPLYGWMNDANGLVYKDGEYHLYFQYNPYGSVWGNMHWGHSVSNDLIHWKHLDPAIARDTLGHIFSGSAIVDKENQAGYGKDAIIAFYTSASDKNGQIQCMAHSEDNGYTYTKYEKNPILTPFDGLKDFRDPKVFWYAPDEKWVMVVSADKEIRFYSSSNLKDWTYMSGFGEGYGMQPSQFECPDFIQLPVDGDTTRMKWALIVNINPGCLFGGSATQYFTGDFNGKEFICDTQPEVVKWLDWGKDHYATVCFSNTDQRIIAVPWMSNWQYANFVPTKQFRSANALPRELFLYTENGDIYMGANVVKEAESLRKEHKEIPAFSLEHTYLVENLFAKNQGAMEINVELVPEKAQIEGIELQNSLGEKVKIYLDMKATKLVMDRTQSGVVDFGRNSIPHAKETHDHRKTNSINYVDDFALATWAPIQKATSYSVQIFVDRCSIELFLNGGKVAMTNLVFPNEPYNTLQFYSEGGQSKVNKLNVYRLE